MTDIDIAPVWEDVPATGRGRGSNPIQWEKLLDPFRSHEGQSGRLFVFSDDGDKSGEKQARSRAAAMSRRLAITVPTEKWSVQARAMNADKSQFGVWVTYDGTYTPEQVADRAEKSAARAAARQARKDAEAAATAPVAQEPADSAPGAPADAAPAPDPRVAAAKAKAAAAKAAAK